MEKVSKTDTAAIIACFCFDYIDALLRDPQTILFYQGTNSSTCRAMISNRLSYFFDERTQRYD